MTVYLVGAGPGDPGLLTLRAAELLARADVVVHDRLVDPRVLKKVGAGAEVVDLGGWTAAPDRQPRINDLLVRRGREGACVVRLKGGDPFVFARGGEEAQALEEAGVAFEVVPGVSAATAVAAYAGVPVTHRGLASSVTIVTGHAGGDVDWGRLADTGGTLVVLMGAAGRAAVAERLLAAGRPPDTPVLAVTRGTTVSQRAIRTTLGSLAAVEVENPATLVIGAVAGLRLDWWSRRLLAGRSVVVTRAAEQAPALSHRLEELGADVVELPTIAIAGPRDGGAALSRAVAELRTYDWVVLTSANGAHRLMDLVGDARSFGCARIAAIGPGTAAALAGYRIRADLIPDRFLAEGLLDDLPAPPRHGGRVLLARAAEARDVLPRGLEAAGWSVDVVEAYRTVRPDLAPSSVERARRADIVTLTASSTAERFVEVVGPDFSGLVVAIGPVTAATARALGLHVDAEAARHDLDGLVEAVVGIANGGSTAAT